MEKKTTFAEEGEMEWKEGVVIESVSFKNATYCNECKAVNLHQQNCPHEE